MLWGHLVQYASMDTTNGHARATDNRLNAVGYLVQYVSIDTINGHARATDNRLNENNSSLQNTILNFLISRSAGCLHVMPKILEVHTVDCDSQDKSW